VGGQQADGLGGGDVECGQVVQLLVIDLASRDGLVEDRRVCGNPNESMDMPERDTYTVPEAAKRVGISRNAAYEAIKRGELPALRIGSRLVVPRAALERLLETCGTCGRNSPA
jgi:excisionase family DNA binding protein